MGIGEWGTGNGERGMGKREWFLVGKQDYKSKPHERLHSTVPQAKRFPVPHSPYSGAKLAGHRIQHFANASNASLKLF